MSAVETLRTLISGARPASGLLHTARLDGFGREAYGEEAVVKCFQMDREPLSDETRTISVPGHLALIDHNRVWFADLAGNAIARIWRLGPRLTDGGTEPALDVVFDADLTQSRGGVFMAASDHPGLASDACSVISAAAKSIVQDYQPSDRITSDRTRVFVIRAFGNLELGAALCTVYRLAGRDKLSSGFALAAIYWSGESVQTICDADSEWAVTSAQWTPSLARLAHDPILQEQL
jgi:hypothetical protein